MICVERVHRIIMALVIIASIGVMHMGYFFEGTYILIFVASMMVIWSVFNFCPMVSILRKILPDCAFKK